MDRLIAHIDMDAFYASVELLRYPELRGRAVVIGGGRDSQPKKRADGSHEFSSLRHYTGRGVVTTSTYEARKLGVFSAMGMMKSALLAPDAILLPVDFDEYRKYSRLFKAAVREIAPVIEDRGIDEIYVDLSDEPGVHDDAGPRDRQRHQGGGARAHRPHLLDRHHAEQAALQARLRARQARRPDAARPRTTCRRASGRSPRAR
jgi:nucleotidyltransferase/DNA polymerase involved in DNA repair